MYFFFSLSLVSHGQDGSGCEPQSLPSVNELNESILEPVNQCLFPPMVEGEEWDVFWAQHYAGTDLLREELEKIQFSREDVFSIVGIWDIDVRQHGEQVSNLVGGPKDSAVIPLNKTMPYINFSYDPYDTKNTFHEGYTDLYKNCHQKEINCPIYINNSFRWLSNPTIGRLASMMSSQGTTIVTAAGNSGSPMDPLQAKVAKSDRVIPVASLGPDGYPTASTSYGDGVDIIVPSGESMRSYNFEGERTDFGFTSGGAPLVTGTLGGFTLLSGYPLATHEIKHLLSKTAIPMPYLPSDHLLGAGILNSYKISQVALRIKEKCKGHSSDFQKNECMQDALRIDSTYQFEEESAGLFNEAIDFFPECRPENPSEKVDNSCEEIVEKQYAFTKLRKAAFLNPTNPGPWQALACVKEKHIEDDTTSGFYQALGQPRRSKEDIIRNLCQANLGDTRIRLAQYIPDLPLKDFLEDRTCSWAVLDIVAKSLFAPRVSNSGDLLEDLLNHSQTTGRTLAILIEASISQNIDQISNFQETADRLLAHTATNPTTLISLIKMASENANKFSNYNEYAERFLAHTRNNDDSLAIFVRETIRNADEISNYKRLLDEVIDNHPYAGPGTLISFIRAIFLYNKSLFAEYFDRIMGHLAVDSRVLIVMIDAILWNIDRVPNYPKYLKDILEHEQADESVRNRLEAQMERLNSPIIIPNYGPDRP